MTKLSKSLVVQHLEKLSRELIEDYQDIIRDNVKGKQGVYALYSGGRLVYVGLATDLKSRLGTHLRDRHAQSWDKFSVYITDDDEHLRELEALVIRIAAPPENRVKGKFAKSENLLPRVRKDFTRNRKKEENRLFCVEEMSRSVYPRGGNKTPARKKRKESEQSSAQNSGLSNLKECIRIRADYKGGTYHAKIRRNGSINFQGEIFNNVSKAGKAVTGKHALNGWKFWKYQNRKGEWIYIDQLRKKGDESKPHKKPPSSRTALAKSSRSSVLGPYVNRSLTIRTTYKGKTYQAKVFQDGRIGFAGRMYTSPSEASVPIIGRSANGWTFWKYKNENGEWLPLDAWRKGSKPPRKAKSQSGSGLLRTSKKGLLIRAVYRGKNYFARYRKDGIIEFEGKEYSSPSGAGKAVKLGPVDGWFFWKFMNERGEWVYMDKLRKNGGSASKPPRLESRGHQAKELL